MATITTHHDESLVESNEILYTNANMIDSEPLYKNFTTIQAFRQQNNEEKQSNTVGSRFYIKLLVLTLNLMEKILY